MVYLIYCYVLSLLLWRPAIPLLLCQWRLASFFFKAPEKVLLVLWALASFNYSLPMKYEATWTERTLKGAGIGHFGQWIVLSWKQWMTSRRRKSSLPSACLLESTARSCYEKGEILNQEGESESYHWR